MATTDARPGFRLPWSSERTDADSPLDGPTEDRPHDETEDAAPAGLASADQEIDTTMIDAASAASDHVVAAEEVSGDTMSELAPTTEPTPEPASPAPSTPAAVAPAGARKPNKFMADLTKAMQVAAETERSDTLARFTAEAKAHIEEIHASSASEASDLRKRADDDVLSIREWSKAEIARIREETDKRINDRKAGLEGEIEEHAAAIEARIERVQARVSAFESEMAAFFERLLAEDDPTRFAAMAESLPEPPSFDDGTTDDPTASDAWRTAVVAETDEPATAVVEPVVEATTDTTVEATTDAGVVETPDAEATATPFTDDPTDATTVETSAVETGVVETAAIEDDPGTGFDPADPRVAALGLTPDFAAAEAEAAAFSGDEAPADDDIPLIADEALAARLAGLVPDAEEAAQHATTRVIVTGLVSVASIAGFKRQLARANGVQSVGVSSGPDGEFVFAVGHHSETVVRELIGSLPGFGARVTGERDGDLTVTARDPESEG